MGSLDQDQMAKAVIYDEAPMDILTYNSTKVSFPFRPQGLAADQMTGAQEGGPAQPDHRVRWTGAHRPCRAEAGRDQG